MSALADLHSTVIDVRGPESFASLVRAVGGVDQVGRLRELLNSGAPVALFGAGNVGRQSLRALRSLGVEPLCFADETPAKIGQSLDGLTVCAPEEAARRIGPRGLFVCSFYFPRASLAAECARLTREFGSPALPFLPLLRLAPSAFSERYAFETTRQAVEGAVAQVEWLFQRLEGARSQTLLAAQYAFRVTLDPNVLPPPEPPLGALADIGVAFDSAHFVDCGAYDGDTVEAFLAVSDGRFRRITAYEPDSGNFARLMAKVERLPAAARSRINCCNQGVWSKDGRAEFASTGTPGSALSQEGGAQVEVIALDRHIAPEPAMIVKLDVEGAEAQALHGGRALLAGHTTIACVSVYHRPDDLWRLPMLLDEIAPGRTFRLCAHGYDGADLMIYSFAR